MANFSRKRLFLTVGMCVLVVATTGLGQERGQTVTGDVLNTLPLDAPQAIDFKVPPRPAGHVLDTAKFLGTEMLQRLDSELLQEASAHGVDIFLLTVPSVPKNGFDAFTQKVAESWMGGLFGALIVFDDATGQVSVQPSDKVTSRFYDFELSVLLRGPMSAKNRPKQSREGLEHTARTLKTALHELKLRADRDDSNSRITTVSIIILSLAAALWGGLEYFRQRSKTLRKEAIEPGPV